MTEEFKLERNITTQLVIEQLENNIYHHNSSAIGKDDGVLFSMVLKDKDNVLVAGVAGWTWAAACEITHLWVDASVRKKGLGLLLLKEAEKEAQTKHCEAILIKSYGFQAPEFYSKHGYQTECIIPDFPKGHDYYLLRKRLA